MKKTYLKALSSLTVLLISGFFATQAIAAAPNARIVVAKAGGNYTTITAALNAIVPSATKPYTIEVWPGTYVEKITLKSYVHLKGMGREVTFIKSPTVNDFIIYGVGLTNTAVTGLSITGGDNGIMLQSASNITIADNSIYGNRIGLNFAIGSYTVSGNQIFSNSEYGMYASIADCDINNNIVTGSGIFGLIVDGSLDSRQNGGAASKIKISGNSFSGNTYDGINLYGQNPVTVVTNNVISNNGRYGLLDNGNVISTPTITNNTIVNNGGAADTDLNIQGNSVANISFNVYDDITGSTGVGSYNVTSTGIPAPAP